MRPMSTRWAGGGEAELQQRAAGSARPRGPWRRRRSCASSASASGSVVGRVIVEGWRNHRYSLLSDDDGVIGDHQPARASDHDQREPRPRPEPGRRSAARGRGRPRIWPPRSRPTSIGREPPSRAAPSGPRGEPAPARGGVAEASRGRLGLSSSARTASVNFWNIWSETSWIMPRPNWARMPVTLTSETTLTSVSPGARSRRGGSLIFMSAPPRPFDVLAGADHLARCVRRASSRLEAHRAPVPRRDRADLDRDRARERPLVDLLGDGRAGQRAGATRWGSVRKAHTAVRRGPARRRTCLKPMAIGSARAGGEGAAPATRGRGRARSDRRRAAPPPCRAPSGS